jgi:nicotinamidase-related amidase
MLSQVLAQNISYESGKAALLIVDMQNKWLTPDLNPFISNEDFYNEIKTRTIPNIERVLLAARKNGIEVIHIQGGQKVTEHLATIDYTGRT